jgi:hypothetical protein
LLNLTINIDKSCLPILTISTHWQTIHKKFNDTAPSKAFISVWYHLDSFDQQRLHCRCRAHNFFILVASYLCHFGPFGSLWVLLRQCLTRHIILQWSFNCTGFSLCTRSLIIALDLLIAQGWTWSIWICRLDIVLHLVESEVPLLPCHRFQCLLCQCRCQCVLCFRHIKKWYDVWRIKKY